MNAIVDLSWRAYPASLLMLTGLAALIFGGRACLAGLRLQATPQIISMMRGFRIMVLGITLACVGAAWLWHIQWLLVLGLVFGGEEILESSTYLRILRNPHIPPMREAAALATAPVIRGDRIDELVLRS